MASYQALTALGTMGLIIISTAFIFQRIGISNNEEVKLLSPLSPTSITKSENENILLFDAWLPWWDGQRIVNSLYQSVGHFRYLSPMWYQLTEEGSISTYSAELKDEISTIIDENEVMLLPTIGNNLDGKRAAMFLENENLWDEVIEYLIEEGELYGFDGYDFDWEEIPEANADEYVDFIERVKSRFDEKEWVLSVTVHARTGTNKDWKGVLGHDYEALANIADHVRVMAYDFHFSTSDPGTVTPLDWYIKVIKYSLDKVGIDKLIIGLPLYGYDWGESMGEAVMFDDVMNRVTEYEGEVVRDEVDGGLTAYYALDEIEHDVWFDDAESVIQKIELARERGVYQFVFWRLGGEDVELWNKLNILNGTSKNE